MLLSRLQGSSTRCRRSVARRPAPPASARAPLTPLHPSCCCSLPPSPQRQVSLFLPERGHPDAGTARALVRDSTDARTNGSLPLFLDTNGCVSDPSCPDTSPVDLVGSLLARSARELDAIVACLSCCCALPPTAHASGPPAPPPFCTGRQRQRVAPAGPDHAPRRRQGLPALLGRAAGGGGGGRPPVRRCACVLPALRLRLPASQPPRTGSGAATLGSRRLPDLASSSRADADGYPKAATGGAPMNLTGNFTLCGRADLEPSVSWRAGLGGGACLLLLPALL